MYKDLRNLSINQLKEYNFDGYALGGLSVGETHNEMKEIINHSVFLNFLRINKIFNGCWKTI